MSFDRRDKYDVDGVCFVDATFSTRVTLRNMLIQRIYS